MKRHRFKRKDGDKMLSKFNEKTQKLIAIAESQAFDFGHASVGTEHLLLALLKVKETKLKSILLQQQITYEIIKEKIVDLFGTKDLQPFYMEYTPSLKRVMEKAVLEAKKLGNEKAGIDVLTYSLLNEEENVAKEILKQFDVDVDKLKKQIKKEFKRTSELDQIDDLLNLNTFTLKSDDVFVEREDELNQLIDVLLRRQKPNAIILGEPGVGKTAIVYELARRMRLGSVPLLLKSKTIYELDLSSVVAGTKYRGEFEEKLKKIVKKVKEDKNAILFIDEIHNMIGAGGAEGAIDASNILKPYLSRGDIQVIGATTYDEYMKIFEKEKALNRRFQVVKIEEPSMNKTLKMLENVAPIYEKFHDVEIPSILLKGIVSYCKNYVQDKYFPDKAIDTIDFACVRAKKNDRKVVLEEDVIKVIEDLYKVKISKEEKAKVFKEEVCKDIVGQEKAIEKIVNLIKCMEQGLIEENRPLGVYLFVGPTGVGKTEFAKLLAKTYFGDESKLIKIDMAEFMGKETVNKLIGSPPGFVGYDEPSHLVSFMKKTPHCVVLLDEIEKAHRDVLDIFLNVFDEGYFYDASKKKVDFTNSIIIMTSNLGFGDEVFNKSSLGFVERNISKDEIEKAIRMHFRPEFLNRIDEIVQFNILSQDVCMSLAKRYINEYCSKTMLESSLLDDELLDIVKESKIEKYGARGIRREVRKRVMAKLINKAEIEVI